MRCVFDLLQNMAGDEYMISFPPLASILLYYLIPHLYAADDIGANKEKVERDND